tara:strand:+ start:362 stop:964 length:603 start_codon:yes stop_codon:yes gene_type:complete
MIDIGKLTDLTNFNPVPLNRYIAKIFCPVVKSNFNIDTQTLAMAVESAELPGKTITTSDARLYGPLRKIPYNLGFIDSTFTFMCSDAFIVEKRFFDNWADFIIDPNTFDAEYHDNLVGNINLQLLDNHNEVMYEVDYLEVFPINVSAMNVGFGQTNDYAKFSVTFSYRKWKKKDIEFNTPSQRSLNPADRLQIPNSNQGG